MFCTYMFNLAAQENYTMSCKVKLKCLQFSIWTNVEKCSQYVVLFLSYGQKSVVVEHDGVIVKLTLDILVKKGLHFIIYPI